MNSDIMNRFPEYKPFLGPANPPSYLSGLSDLATPEEWRTQGSAFVAFPNFLQSRASTASAGRAFQLEKFQSQYDPSSSDWFRESPEATKLRQYQMGRESEELERMKISAEKSKLQSQMAFQPQMDAIRSGIMSRMGGNFGANMPKSSSSYGRGTSYTPSWMQNYKTPSFPR